MLIGKGARSGFALIIACATTAIQGPLAESERYAVGPDRIAHAIAAWSFGDGHRKTLAQKTQGAPVVVPRYRIAGRRFVGPFQQGG